MIASQLADLWEQTSRRAKNPRNWIKRWRLSHQFDLDFLRLSEMHIAIPKGKVSNCTACEEICCTGPKAIIHLRLRDIAVLLDQGLAENIETARKPDEQYLVTKSDAEKEFDESLFAQVFPTLTRDDNGTCKLLSDKLACSVYPHWPLSCARYPFAVDATNKVIFYAKGCNSYEILPPQEPGTRFGYLVNAAVESYNERVKDIFFLAFAFQELKELGLTQYLDTIRLQKEWRWLVH